ncbi:aldehyde dehydrogenase [Sessilibacter corallicola]|uniref:aldehyde dehydrogenase n=1 Tax=Sessilibacter corallicola TaxID=2904075 RepID=UPI001E3375AC|nr:aldehyde dehydrogenase [Sessilibacter corallicola]MCE2027619.1 aldehyde dehydrogenase [Sessilibacter corallicola]
MAQTKDKNYWVQLAESVTIPVDNIIDGKPVQATSGKTFTCISPIDGRVLAEIPSCSQADADAAVESARKAFDSGVWSQTAPVKRKKVLIKFADLILQHADELAILETLDMGKPIGDSTAIDIPATANCIRWNAEAIDKVYDEVAPTHPNELGLVTREPLGVVAAIVPWNFPLIMAAWKLGPALATGNSVVLKPSEKSPLTALRIGQLALDAGIPAGVLNVITGFGKDAGEPLAKHMDVDGLVFTGSTAVGKHLLSLGAISNMKRTFVECGGKSPNIVFPDAPDLKAAAKAAAVGIFFNQGEVCTAGSRLLVHNVIKKEFIAEVIEAAKSLQPGHPLDPDTSMGAIVDQQQMSRVLGYVDKGTADGATIVAGGKQAMSESGGFYIEPTIFDDVTNQMTIAQEEIFGPVLSCIGFDSEEEAIAIANDTDYGLAAAIWTSDLARAHRVSRKVRAGSVWVNYYDAGDMTAPFGGFKQSGNGRDKSLHALEKYTELKATWMNLNY